MPENDIDIATYLANDSELIELRTNLAHTTKALGIMQEIPKEVIDMELYGQTTGCGTLYCTAGHLAQHEYFKELGMELKPVELSDKSLSWQLLFKGNQSVCFSSLFGSVERNVWRDLFAPTFDSKYDKDMIQGSTDKELALNRLRMHEQFLIKSIKTRTSNLMSQYIHMRKPSIRFTQ